LEWAEITSKLKPTAFTIKTMPRRLEKTGDIWQPVLGKPVDITKVLRKLG
jgi:bifunctional non-homologous end joining protein LigD